MARLHPIANRVVVRHDSRHFSGDRTGAVRAGALTMTAQAHSQQ